ncbi:MAG: hypothetical protein KF773_15980 [Deltaproteobacteria bacterium]|nr:hypothetical protein [Deltaproteobacteria bacterium]
MKRWQRSVLAYAVVSILVLLLLFAIIIAIGAVVDRTDHVRYLGGAAIFVSIYGASKILAIRDRIRGA